MLLSKIARYVCMVTGGGWGGDDLMDHINAIKKTMDGLVCILHPYFQMNVKEQNWKKIEPFNTYR